MSEPFLILLVSGNTANVQSIREALAGDERFHLQHIERTRTAAARIAGGGVAGVLLDISPMTESQREEALASLRAASHEVPVITVSDRAEEPRDLSARVLAALGSRTAVGHGSTRAETERGTIIAVLGAKGGVGATTIAANVASVLASHKRVILAELRPPLGTLCHFFRPHRGVRTLANLISARPAEIQTADVEGCLWPNRSIPGLSVLFAPDQVENGLALGPDHAAAILGHLSALSDVVIVDLPSSLSEINRDILRRSETLVFVVERDPFSLDAAKNTFSGLERADSIPREAGSAIVNRVPLASPTALADVESQLGLPTFAVIPPAADLCVAAYRAHTPVVKLDAQSSIATSFVQLAKRFWGQA